MNGAEENQEFFVVTYGLTVVDSQETENSESVY
jgi:hypothetical protein